MYSDGEIVTVTIEKPNSGSRKNRGLINWEKWAWIYMRASGILLVILIFGHLFVNLMVGEGVKAVDFAFVAGKFTDPFWVVWDTAMLWLALIHGANGMRTLVNDYAVQVRTRIILHGALIVSTAALLILGTLTIYAFDPCPADAPSDLLPSFCAEVM